MRRILDRERARVDRNRSQFSLLVFTPREPESSRETLARLVRRLHRRLRFTDEVGWFDERQIGVVLPDTPASGAWKVADDICLKFSSHELPPLCTVYAYPSDAMPFDEMSSDHGKPKTKRATHAMEILFAQAVPRWKRTVDLAGASLGVILLMPLLAVVTLAIKLTSPGPVLFRQWRSGLGGKPFLMYKFRTMHVDAEARQASLMALNEQDGPAFKIRKDPRVTPLGRLLRSTSIDELPQLWNVLLGDMSLVGPRPLPCHESDACMPWQRRRLDVTPGLTCIWQVSGRSSVTFNEWVRMDLRYLRTRSFLGDMWLLVATVPAVLLRKGAS
jgi:lipopolysaccharide/colanic/teichoic acid biosynthesis glycosyltransferase